MTRSLPAWGRLFLIALVVSVVLHGIALDVWRGMAGPGGALGGGLRQVVLQARLQTASADRAPEKPSAMRLGEEVTERASTRPALPASVARRSVQRPVASAGDVPSPVTAASIGEAGLRPLSRAEGLVAYRLALLAALRAPPIVLTAPAQLTLNASLGGAQVEIRESSGDAMQDQAWREEVLRAVVHAEVPAVLAGQSFMLELEFQPR